MITKNDHEDYKRDTGAITIFEDDVQLINQGKKNAFEDWLYERDRGIINQIKIILPKEDFAQLEKIMKPSADGFYHQPIDFVDYVKDAIFVEGEE